MDGIAERETSGTRGPGPAIDALLAVHPDWDDADRERAIDGLLAGSDRDELARAVADRLPDGLQGEEGTTLLRLIEAIGDPALLDRLATAIVEPSGLSNDRLAEARFVLRDLVPIVAVGDEPGDDPWPSVVEELTAGGMAIRVATGAGESESLATRAGLGRIRESLVTAVDGEGRGLVAMSAWGAGGGVVSAGFACDLTAGVIAVRGRLDGPEGPPGGLIAAFADGSTAEAAFDAHRLAIGLLGGCLAIGPTATVAGLDGWLALLFGPGAGALPPLVLVDDAGTTAGPPGPSELADRARAVLDACPGWVDRSPLTAELAEEIALREGSFGPDPARDAGAYRYLFEHRLGDRTEVFRRMLAWMAGLWRATGDDGLADGALALADELSDPQHAVPRHPFFVELATRSLATAIDERRGDLGH